MAMIDANPGNLLEALRRFLLAFFARKPQRRESTALPPVTYDEIEDRDGPELRERPRIDVVITSPPLPEAPGPDPHHAMLSEHFSLAEFTFSQTAVRKGIDNTPPPKVLAAMVEHAAPLAERIRVLLGGRAMPISSGYRCEDLNEAVGGAPNSAHRSGYAFDFTCPSFGTPNEVARAIAMSPLMADIDQLIDEFGRWVHVSADPRRRGELLTVMRVGGHTRTIKGLMATGGRLKLGALPQRLVGE